MRSWIHLAREPAPQGAGSSGKPLVAKLGIRRGWKLAALHAPEGYVEWIAPLPDDVRLDWALDHPPYEFIHIFVVAAPPLQAAFPLLRAMIVPDGSVWVSWPKRSAQMSSALDGSQVRDLGLAAGLVDVKVASVDATWSALKFVIRLKERNK